jgi:hypothetical protein
MTREELKAFAESQIAFYTKDLKVTNHWIGVLTDEIKRHRESDKRFVQRILDDPNESEYVKNCFRNPNYKSTDYRKAINERARLYRWRKHCISALAQYKKEVQMYETGCR